MTDHGNAAPQGVDIVVRGGWLLTMNPERDVYTNGFVAISGSKIVDVGSEEELAPRYAANRTIRADQAVVIPGMTNGHRHILSTPRGASVEGLDTLGLVRRLFYPSYEALTEDDMQVYAIHHSAELLRFGTTLFEDPGCTYLDAVVEGVASTGIRCRTGPWTWDHGGPSSGTLRTDWLKMTTAAAVKRLEDGIRTVRSFGNPRIRDAVTVEGAGTCSDELNIAGAKLAADADSLFVLHKASSEQEVELELAAFGHRPLEHMYRIGALNEYTFLNHMTSLDLFEVDMVAERGARISHNPSSAIRLAKGTTQTGKWPELLEANVPVALGTDAENASNYQDVVRAMHLAALLPRDARHDPAIMPPEHALEMATIGGAKAMRWDDEVGSIEVGKDADLVIFDTNDFDLRPLHNPITSLVYNATGHSVDTVIVGGDVLVRRKKLVHVDEEDIREQVAVIERRILKELGVDARPSWPIH